MAQAAIATFIDKDQYQKEQDKLLNTVLEYRFFNPWRSFGEYGDSELSLAHDSNVELYVSAKCNQHCEYCYLIKHPEIYPPEVDKPELILHNLELFYKYCIVHKYHIPTLDFFSGEIWHTKLGMDILELTYTYTLYGLQYDKILIASNCYFVNFPEKLHQVQNYIQKFAELGKQLVFSISVDGAVIDNYDRQRNNHHEYNEDYYDLLFTFAKHNTFYFHPMVSAHNVHLWHENFEWWKKKYDEYGLDFFTCMLLEVRNDEWTDETIDLYCKFILELADYYLTVYCNNDIERFANIIGNVRFNPEYHFPGGYHPWTMSGSVDTFVGCTIATHLAIRLGDLAICPCHRTAYSKYLYGHFKVENDMITGVTANNPQMAIKILMGNAKTNMHGCDICLYKECCLKGCLGAQTEATGDPFFPCKSVCKMLQTKYSTLLQYYKDKGIFDYFKSFSMQEKDVDQVLNLLRIYEAWEESKRGMGKRRDDFSPKGNSN